MPEESLIEKLKRVIEQHNRETNERVNMVTVRWIIQMGGYADVQEVSINVEK